MRKLQAFLVGLTMCLFSSPAFAAWEIPYVIHDVGHGGEWWTGLAFVNNGPIEHTVRVRAVMNGTIKDITEVNIPAGHTKVSLLPALFVKHPFPNTPVSLIIEPVSEYASYNVNTVVVMGRQDGSLAFQSREFDWSEPGPENKYVWIDIPYAQHSSGWWSSLALVNSGSTPLELNIISWRANVGTTVGTVTLPPYSIDARMIPGFFETSEVPDGPFRIQVHTNAGAGALKSLRATFFLGQNGGGFDFQEYRPKTNR